MMKLISELTVIGLIYLHFIFGVQSDCVDYWIVDEQMYTCRNGECCDNWFTGHGYCKDHKCKCDGECSESNGRRLIELDNMNRDKHGITETEKNEIIKHFDKNMDGKITFEELRIGS